MTWKTYAAMSGATVLAGWLASSSPPGPADSGPAAGEGMPRSPAAVSDIEQEAARLQTRLRAAVEYAAPRRDPFRFAAGPRGEPAGDSGATGAPVPAPAVSEPEAPRVQLSGIAEDDVNGRRERTAVLSSPAGVLLVGEGEEILAYYRVVRIESEAVELERLSDGTTLRLALGR